MLPQMMWSKTTGQLKWIDLKDYPLYGTLVTADSLTYTRLPDTLKGVIRDDLYALGTNTAGMYIRFASDATDIGARWKATKKFDMNHMTATGIRGLDLYTRLDDGTWTTVGSGRPNFFKHNTTAMIMPNMERKMRDYMLYLPLYDGVDSIYIGVDSAAVVASPIADSPRQGNPIIMYGTSILQGGCASRPGMVHTSQISRALDREVINLGFSGNARLDPEIAELIASGNPSLIVLDALPNLTVDMLSERFDSFMAIIRKSLPDTPVLVIESPIFPSLKFNIESREVIELKNRTLKTLFDKLIEKGDKNLYYFKGEDVLGDVREGTVDNSHFTDLGFTVFTANLLPAIKAILGE